MISTLAVATAGSTPDGFAGWALDLMDRLGGAGAGAAIALENVFPPIPSEAILPLAGFSAGQGRFSLGSAIAWTTAGSTVGALVLYVLGAWLGISRLRAIVERLPLMHARDVDRSAEWFTRHGSSAVFIGRMIPVFRSLISIPAGLDRMPLWRFVVLTVLGSAIWNTAFVLAGYGLGRNWDRVEPFAGAAEKIVVVVVVIAVLAFVVVRVRSRGRQAQA